MSLPYRYSKERTLKHLPKWRKPSPAMIVAIAALVVSIGGTAVAGPIAEISLNKGEKKQVRKITRNIAGKVSNRRITKRAPGLAVASSGFANIANVANAANTAINANNAENAENAEELGGKDPGDYASSAQGIKGAFTFDDGDIEEPFNAINGGSYVVLEDTTEVSKIALPFPVAGRVAVVSGGAITQVGGHSPPFPDCAYTVQNLSATSIQVNHVNAEGAGGCGEEWSIIIF